MEAIAKRLRSGGEKEFQELGNTNKKKKATSKDTAKPKDSDKQAEDKLVEYNANFFKTMTAEVEKSSTALVCIWASLCIASGVVWNFDSVLVASAIFSVYVIRLGSMRAGFEVPGLFAFIPHALLCVELQEIRVLFCTQVVFATCRYASVCLVVLQFMARPKSGKDLYSFLVPFLVIFAVVVSIYHKQYDCDYFQGKCTFEDVYGYYTRSAVAVAEKSWWHGAPFALYELFSVFVFVHSMASCLYVVGGPNSPAHGLASLYDTSALFDAGVDAVIKAMGSCLYNPQGSGGIAGTFVALFFGAGPEDEVTEEEETQQPAKGQGSQKKAAAAAAKQPQGPGDVSWLDSDFL